MSKPSRDSRATARIRHAYAGPTAPGLVRLAGLAEALSAASGTPLRRVVRRRGWQDACADVAAAAGSLHGPPAPLRLRSVRTGRSVSGLVPDGVPDLVGLARTVAAGRRVPVLVVGDCPPRVARAFGLRIAGRRRWPEALRPAVEAVVRDFTTWCVVSEDPGWHSALVMPRVGEAGREVHALVVLSPSPLAIRVVALPASVGGGPADLRAPHLIRSAVADALSGPEAAVPTLPSRLPSGAWALRSVWPDYDERRHGEALAYWAEWAMGFSERAALAAFRRTLPAAAGAVAGLAGREFRGPFTCIAYLAERAGWTAEDHGRVLQALRAVPWLIQYANHRPTLDAARAGKPLEEVVRVLSGHERPLHPKVVRCLRASWRMKASHGTVSALALTVGALEALYRADPHRPVLSPAETRHAVSVLCGLGDMVHEGPQGAAAVLALRDAGGRLQPPPPHLRDYARWVEDTLGRMLAMTRELDAERMPAAGALAAQVVFPPHCRSRGLAEAVGSWHARIGAMSDAFNAFSHEFREANRLDAEARAGVVPDELPRLAEGPERIGAVTLRPLVDERDLAEEGRTLGHCVGSYLWSLQAGRCVLLGLSSEAGRSTAEIHAGVADGVARLTVHQHQGFRNGPAPDGHAEALASFLAARAPEDVERLRAELAGRAARAAILQRMQVRDLRPEQMRALADLLMEQLRRFLSGPDRSLPRVRWIEQRLLPVVSRAA